MINVEIGEFVSLISNNSFPIVVSAFLLIRLEKQMTNIATSVNTLNTIVTSILEKELKSSKDY